MAHDEAGAEARSWAATWRGGLALVVLGLCVLLPGLRALPPVDRDESRFAQASRQMLASDTVEGWVVPRVGDRPRLNKPPLVYWAQAGSAWLLGEREGEERDVRTGDVWRFRVPSVLCAIGAALITWRLGLSMFGRVGREAHAAIMAAAMLLVCPMVAWDGRQARADQLLLVVTTGAMWALWSLWRADERAAGARRLPWSSVIAFWIAVALGILAKGPVTPMVAGLAAIALCAMTRRWRFLLRLRPEIGALVIATLVGPWVVLVAQRVGWGEYAREVYDEVIARSASAREGHWGPPGYHVALLAVMFWPGSLMVFRGIAMAVREASAARSAQDSPRSSRLRAWWNGTASGGNVERFLVAWVVPSWLVFELVSTKLPHYVMPLYPALALIAARQVMTFAPASPGAQRVSIAAWLWRVVWLGLGGALVVGAPLLLPMFGGFDGSRSAMVTMGVLVGAGAAMIIGAARALWAGAIPAAKWLSIGAATCGVIAGLGIALPRLNAPWVGPRIATALHETDPSGVRPLAAVEYHEDSLVFLTGGRVQRIARSEADDWLSRHRGGVLVQPADAAMPLRAREITLIEGFNYSKGEKVVLVIVEKDDSPPGH